MTTLSIGTSAIREQDGLYSLNDLHKASGAAQKHRPAYFLSNSQTRALVDEISKAGNPAIKSKQGVGTYVCKELVIAYAAWISPVFQLKVIRVFLDHGKSQQDSPTEIFSNRRWLVSFDHGRERIQEIDWDDCLIKYNELPKLLASPDNMVSADLLASIAQACIERLQSKTQGLTATVKALRGQKLGVH